jgi:potassium-dependent mechanosensitive channel
MHKSYFFLFIFFLPAKLLAQVSDVSDKFGNLLTQGVGLFERAIHYKIIQLESQSITIENLFIAFVFLIIGLKLAKILSNSLKRKLFSFISLDNNSVNLIGRIIDYLLMIVIVVIVLDVAKVPITIFTFIGGALVVSIGLSSQHLINNFISGIVLIVEGNLKVGDLIEYEDIIGRVEAIEARCLRVRSQNNVEHFIPHSKLMQEKFSHWTSKNGGRIRISTSLKIEDKDAIKNDFEKVIMSAVTQNRNILTTPKPQILLLAFENNILEYEVNFWINLNSVDRRQILSDVNNRILNALNVHHIQLAINCIRHIK